MNRSNIGNVVTNATQTMAVSGFTAAGYLQGQKRAKLGDAASALNNLSEDEVRELGEARAEAARQEIRRSKNEIDGTSRLSDAEQDKLGEKRADDLRKYIKGEPKTVDEAMEDGEDLSSTYDSLKSPQQKELKLSAKRNLEWISSYKKALAEPNPVDDIVEEFKKSVRGDKNADE